MNLRILTEKARELDVQLYMAFIDYDKAFILVWRSLLWNVLIKMGINGHCHHEVTDGAVQWATGSDTN